MSTLADRTIAALRAVHDDLAALVPTLTDEQLIGPSGASEWSVSQVLSHMGSGAEITFANYEASLRGDEAPSQDFNESVWARWDALTPQEQAAGVIPVASAVVEFLEALTPDQRETLQVKLGFMPFPLPLTTIVGMRLHENTLHFWDVRVALDSEAQLDETASAVLFEHLDADMGFLLGFIGKADALANPARVRVGVSDLGFVITDSVSVTTSIGEATATIHGPLESVLRLTAGRLTPGRTPAAVSVEGNVTLDDLRRVFPGY